MTTATKRRPEDPKLVAPTETRLPLDTEVEDLSDEQLGRLERQLSERMFACRVEKMRRSGVEPHLSVNSDGSPAAKALMVAFDGRLHAREWLSSGVQELVIEPTVVNGTGLRELVRLIDRGWAARITAAHGVFEPGRRLCVEVMSPVQQAKLRDAPREPGTRRPRNRWTVS